MPLLKDMKDFLDANNVNGDTFVDLYSGTGSVGAYFKTLGYIIYSSDLLYFSYCLQKAKIQLGYYPVFTGLFESGVVKMPDVWRKPHPAQVVIDYLNNLAGVEGVFYSEYSIEGTKEKTNPRRYFFGENAKMIDAIRQKIEEWRENKLLDMYAIYNNEYEYYYLLACLIEAVSTVGNTCGSFSGFLQNDRINGEQPIKLEMIYLMDNGKRNKAYHGDGVQIWNNELKRDRNWGGETILYLDPPYTTSQYFRNYHILETLAYGDKQIQADKLGLRAGGFRKSRWCIPNEVDKELKKVCQLPGWQYLLLSYSSVGILSFDEIQGILQRYGNVVTKKINRPHQFLTQKPVEEYLFLVSKC